MITILSYNVGIQRSMWDKHAEKSTTAGRWRTKNVLTLLHDYEPDLICLQELGLHEEGLDPVVFSEVFQRDSLALSQNHARLLQSYTVTSNGPYAILAKTESVSVVDPELRPVCDLPAQDWRQVQQSTIVLKPKKNQGKGPFEVSPRQPPLGIQRPRCRIPC